MSQLTAKLCSALDFLSLVLSEVSCEDLVCFAYEVWCCLTIDMSLTHLHAVGVAVLVKAELPMLTVLELSDNQLDAAAAVQLGKGRGSWLHL